MAYPEWRFPTCRIRRSPETKLRRAITNSGAARDRGHVPDRDRRVAGSCCSCDREFRRARRRALSWCSAGVLRFGSTLFLLNAADRGFRGAAGIAAAVGCDPVRVRPCRRIGRAQSSSPDCLSAASCRWSTGRSWRSASSLRSAMRDSRARLRRLARSGEPAEPVLDTSRPRHGPAAAARRIRARSRATAAPRPDDDIRVTRV